jgi:hypothetical protein
LPPCRPFVRNLLATLAAVTATAAPGCSGEPAPPPDETRLPASWHGVWSVTMTLSDCTSGGVVQETTSEQVLCEGAPLRFEFDHPLLTHLVCDGRVTDTTFELLCNQTYPAAPDCDVTLHVTVTGTKAGDSFSGAGNFTTSNAERAAGACADYDPPLCFGLAIEGARLRDPGAQCP